MSSCSEAPKSQSVSTWLLIILCCHSLTLCVYAFVVSDCLSICLCLYLGRLRMNLINYDLVTQNKRAKFGITATLINDVAHPFSLCIEAKTHQGI